MKLLTIVGARPQFIKAAMVSRAIAEHNQQPGREEIKEIIIHTGQHYDTNMSEIFFRELNIPAPEVNLNIGSGSHGDTTGRMLAAIEIELMNRRPDWLLVYGDTNSTLAGALAAAKLHIPVAHVEAGLRSFNRGMPEEVNRVLTDHVSDLLFCPTKTAVSNLANEGITAGVYNVGDVMYEAALIFGDMAEKKSTILDKHCLTPGQYALATVHRAENTDDDTRLAGIMEGISYAGNTLCPVVLPLHPRTRQALNRVGYAISEKSEKNGIIFIDPVSFLDMVMLEKHSKLILTDSGGVQKEAYFHGVRCITLREETEWVETVEAGWNQLAGPKTDLIIVAIDKDVHYTHRNTPYGNGDSSNKIINVFLSNS
jgi:UDP-GlcNAc3NAcA epimerase